jgi:hypothetical protein
MAKKQSPSTLLWFIRRKTYVPLSEIRRRFELEGEEGYFMDGVEGMRVFVGLPENTTVAIGKLWKQGKIGLELSCEFNCKVLIGVFPMNPVRDPELQLGQGPRSGAHHHALPQSEPAEYIPLPQAEQSDASLA